MRLSWWTVGPEASRTFPAVSHTARGSWSSVGTSTSFTGIWALRVLLLSQSNMQALSSLTFLEKLDLAYNELRVLPPDFSQGLTALKDLKLSHNALQRLESHSLEDLESLERLDLSQPGSGYRSWCVSWPRHAKAP
ncbi:leucine-rich repeat-containing protein 4B-like [Cyprinus carpio]|uniref:Leucine-rich repeat-containing protein 4B-like n=1 Tax=Cyprinus carpio TaxID=7962 RepID=A0A9Q9WW70_CYPCA|nr:leucine-rich repeat-containing protein 4B-like [Cyprinus carpio]